MAASWKDPKGDRRTGSMQHPQVPEAGSDNVPDAHKSSSPPLDPAWQMELDIVSMLSRGDGWLRISPDLDSRQVWIKYKLNSTRWPNHYVMTSGPVHRLCALLHTLRRKLQEVDAGAYIPTQDHYFRE